MSSILAPENVTLNASASTQAEVFSLIAAKAVELGIAADAATVVAGLESREKQGTTGLMDGIAIPHAKSPGITSPALVIVRLRESVEWESLDEQPIIMAISLLIPEGEAGTTHLSLLSQVARTLMKPGVRAELLAAESPDAVIGLLSQHVMSGS
ncbi:PTS fructose transporter subunit IIA [Arthrobacter yangruifuii]|uniref:PTS fructose transporter subunit IIA n=1 Tax=Arthrobacter yangruifuii TaxID=2606616 RepID=A0A5N6MQZ2_9MICC|nr:PTS sugar transporter subunit IIA [Arthrobacter yangruifuii]KAD4059585.1 PTS fructose transporter subunit IIA [Arthrobacter yangruifuii]